MYKISWRAKGKEEGEGEKKVGGMFFFLFFEKEEKKIAR